MNENLLKGSPLKENRRNFLKGGLLLGGLALLKPESAISSPIAREADDFKIITGPYLQSNFGNSISILWITSKDSSSWVEYGESAELLDKKAYGKSTWGFKPAGRLNCVKLENLRPGKTYYYKLCAKEIKDFQPYKMTYGESLSSPIESFTNTDTSKDEVSFVMLNDIHDRPKSITHLMDLNKGNSTDFVFFNGDIFDYQNDEQQIITNMLQPCVESFAKNTPFVYVRGNHETRGKFAREFPAYFDHVGNTSFTLGPVRFVILDTGEDKEDSHPVYAGIVDFDQYRIEQAAWLENEINRKEFKNAAFRVVLMHIPPRYSGDAHGAVHCTELFEPIMNRGKVDLVLSGHTHKFKVNPPAKGLNNYPIIIGGGPKDGFRTLTKIKANKKQVEVSMLDDSGKQIAHYVCLKK